jgi:hypothetical protein
LLTKMSTGPSVAGVAGDGFAGAGVRAGEKIFSPCPSAMRAVSDSTCTTMIGRDHLGRKALPHTPHASPVLCRKTRVERTPRIDGKTVGPD